MARNDRVLWKRPEGCLCKAKLRGDDADNGTTGELRLTREVEVHCPLHGERSDVVEEAISAAEAILDSVPGVPKIARPQLRRLIMAALPVVARAAAEGRIPAFPDVVTPPEGPAGGIPGAEPVV